jgi:hypothetical protein
MNEKGAPELERWDSLRVRSRQFRSTRQVRKRTGPTRVLGRRRRCAADRADRADRPGRGPIADVGTLAQAAPMHDPGKVVLDLPVTLALGGDCLADIALLRCAPGCSGRSRRTRPFRPRAMRSQRDAAAALAASGQDVQVRSRSGQCVGGSVTGTSVLPGGFSYKLAVGGGPRERPQPAKALR